MKKVRNIILIFFALVLCIGLFVACDNASDGVYEQKNGSYSLASLTDDKGKFIGARFYGFYFGKSDIPVTIEVYSSDSFSIDFNLGDNRLNDKQLAARNQIVVAFNEIHAFINEVDGYCDAQTTASDVYRYNYAKSGAKIEISKYTYDILLISKEMYQATNGAFNPAVYRLVDLWGFSSRVYNSYTTIANPEPYDREWDIFGYPLPAQKYIDAFSNDRFTDFSDNAIALTQEDGKYFVTKKVKPVVVDGAEYEQWIDLGGVAKGYVVDVIRNRLNEMGIDKCYVDAGSSSKNFGLDYDGGNIALAIDSPFTKSTLFGITESNSSMSISGQYIRRYVGADGVEYSHIIDGVSGRPAQTGIKLVAVVCPQDGYWASKGDCLTTALTVMGRDRLVEFMNGYLKNNGIDVYAVYQDSDKKYLLSNTLLSDLAYQSSEIAQYSWAVSNADGSFSFDADAPLINYKATNPASPVNIRSYKGWLIALGVIVGLCVVAVLVCFFVKGKKGVAANIVNVKKDKPFKLGDIGVYVVVLLVVVVLFGVFFGGDDSASDSVKYVQVVDMQTQELLFAYNVSSGAYQVYDNSSNWTVEVDRSDGFVVTFSKEFDGETHFNQLKIQTGEEFYVKMIDSICGFHQECVKNFPALTRPNGSVVCSPNRLKVITE